MGGDEGDWAGCVASRRRDEGGEVDAVYEDGHVSTAEGPWRADRDKRRDESDRDRGGPAQGRAREAHPELLGEGHRRIRASFTPVALRLHARGASASRPWRFSFTPGALQLHARGASASRPRRFSFTPVAHPKNLNRACLGRARACRLSNSKAPLASLTPKAAPVAYPKPRTRGPKQRRPAAALPVCCHKQREARASTRYPARSYRQAAPVAYPKPRNRGPKQRRARRHATRRAAPHPARKRIVRGLRGISRRALRLQPGFPALRLEAGMLGICIGSRYPGSAAAAGFPGSPGRTRGEPAARQMDAVYERVRETGPDAWRAGGETDGCGL